MNANLIFYFILTMCFTYGDITSPINYHIKFIHLEINYTVSSGLVATKSFDYNHNALATVIDSRKSFNISGRLLVAMSENQSHSNNSKPKSDVNGACSKITTVSDVKWIAVVLKGGTCTLEEKLRYVLKRTNASAVIIVDDSLPKPMERYDFSNNIGLQLTDLPVPLAILHNESIVINASIYVNRLMPDGLISRTSVLLVSIAFILFMIISLVWLTFYYIQRFRYMHAKERLSRRLANAAKKALNKIPVKVLSSEDHEVGNDFDQCAICIDNYQIGETIRILPCKHIFHKICIDSWLIEQRSCPMCKVDILKACGVYGVGANGSSTSRRGTSMLNQGLWISGATVTATAALLEAGIITNDGETGDTYPFEGIESNPSSTAQFRAGHSSFLQRYRERYGLHRCHQIHHKSHCHRLNGHCQKSLKSNENKQSMIMNSRDPDQHGEFERVDLISDSDNSTISHNHGTLQLSIPDHDSKLQTVQTNHQDLHEIANGIAYEIYECSSENTNVDCDLCDSVRNNSGHSSTSCSCEYCCDCYCTQSDCIEGNIHRNRDGVGNLLRCCVTSDSRSKSTSGTDDNSLRQNSSHCCNQTSETFRPLNEFNKSHYFCKHNFLLKTKAEPTADNKTHMNITKDLLIGSCNQKSDIESHPINSNFNTNGCYRQLKSILLEKKVNKSSTIDSYTKSSVSDDFDYEADGGSTSLEMPAQVVKLTVLPPQVQYHQGPSNTDSSHSSRRTTLETINICVKSIDSNSKKLDESDKDSERYSQPNSQD